MKSIVIVVIALVIGILATILTTDMIGATHIFSGGQKQEARKPGAGEILLPLSRTNLPAFEKVGIQDLAMIIVEKNKISGPPAIEDPTKINNRILKANKPAGRYFTEEDFMPEGTAAGIAGATPPGKRGITVRADKITGAYALQTGDTFDLLLTVNSRSAAATSSLLGATGVTGTTTSSTILVVNGGVVLRTVTPRMEAREVRKGIMGAETEIQQTPVNELAIAIDPSEVATLTAAISSNQELVAVVRSGQLGASANEKLIVIPQNTVTNNSSVNVVETEAVNETKPLKSIEVIVGDKRSQYNYTTQNQ